MVRADVNNRCRPRPLWSGGTPSVRPRTPRFAHRSLPPARGELKGHLPWCCARATAWAPRRMAAGSFMAADVHLSGLAEHASLELWVEGPPGQLGYGKRAGAIEDSKASAQGRTVFSNKLGRELVPTRVGAV